MNGTTIRIGGVTVLAALALGFGGTVAQASTAAPASTAGIAATQDQQQAIRAAANALLSAPIEYSVADRAELRTIASGEMATAGKFDGVLKLLEKVPGFAKAVAGSFSELRK